MNVNYVILIENGYVLYDCRKGDVLRETTNAMKGMDFETAKGCFTFNNRGRMCCCYRG
jgi:hypothetical protein